MNERDDLLRLSEAQLAALANVGLLKRARREVDAGRGPQLELREDGTLHAASPDGARSQIGLAPGAPFGTCSCGAPRACRHRIAAVLQYQKEAAVTAVEAFCPSAFTDEELIAHVGQRTVAAAERALASSVAVRVHPGATPSAELPNATVSFWAPDALHLARCDCGKPACVHVVLAVWAFRARPSGGLIVLGGARAADAEALDRVEPVLTALVRTGLAALGDGALLAETRAALQDYVWLRDGFEDLERERERYARQSTVFRAEVVARGVAELLARTRAATAERPALPPTMVLGSALEASGGSDRLRLIGIGASTEADGARRLANAYFVEPISMTVLALRAEWELEGRAPTGAEVGELFASSRRSLAELAGAYLIARGARRRENGLLDLSRARSIQPSNPPGAMWGEVEAPILVRSLDELAARRANEPPALLGPRLVGRDVHVLAIGALDEIGYSPAHQEVRARVVDEAGTPCWVRSFHRDVSPGRVDAIYRGLTEGARRISGRLMWTSDGWTLEPLALVGPRGQVSVPDIEAPRPLEKEVRPALFVEHERRSLFTELEELAVRGVHHGHPSVRVELAALASRFEGAGLLRMSALLRRAQEGPHAFLDVVLASALVPEASRWEARSPAPRV